MYSTRLKSSASIVERVKPGRDQQTIRIDIALDAFPNNVGTTTREAIWQGVPVVAWDGDCWAAQTSATLLQTPPELVRRGRHRDQCIEAAIHWDRVAPGQLGLCDPRCGSNSNRHRAAPPLGCRWSWSLSHRRVVSSASTDQGPRGRYAVSPPNSRSRSIACRIRPMSTSCTSTGWPSD